MSSAQPQAMDVYSNIRIPFTIAAWCREHRFHPLAANLAKVLRATAENQQELDRLEARDRALFGEVQSLIKRIESEDCREENVKHGVAASKKPVTLVRRAKAEEA